MAWFCRRCDDWMLFNSTYCDDCQDIRWEREEAREKAISKVKEEKKKTIHKQISNYQKEQISYIKEKYGTLISLKSNKGKVLSKNKNIQYEIDDLKKERMEIEESIRELEAIKNETLK